MRIAGMRSVFASALTFVLATGCGVPAGSGSVPLASDGPAVAPPSGTSHPASTTAAGATGTGGPASTTAPAPKAAFLSHVFTDVRDGKTFTLGGFEGKQVLVIGMAVW